MWSASVGDFELLRSLEKTREAVEKWTVKDSPVLTKLKTSRYPQVPSVVHGVHNWMPFLHSYILRDQTARTYTLRNGLVIATQERIDTAAIVDIFFKKDYGDIPDRSVVVDIGAHIGAFSLYAVSTSIGTTVHAYEPMEKSYEVLSTNIKVNELEDRVVPHKAGIAAQRGKRRLFLFSHGLAHSLYPESGAAEYMEIECVSLQDVFDLNGIERCNLLKMNCEGAEFESIYNTPDAYLQRIDDIRVNYHEFETDEGHETYNGRGLADFLSVRGFRVTKFQPGPMNQGALWVKRERV